jgi:hypothetical protein
MYTQNKMSDSEDELYGSDESDNDENNNKCNDNKCNDDDEECSDDDDECSEDECNDDNDNDTEENKKKDDNNKISPVKTGDFRTFTTTIKTDYSNKSIKEDQEKLLEITRELNDVDMYDNGCFDKHNPYDSGKHYVLNKSLHIWLEDDGIEKKVERGLHYFKQNNGDKHLNRQILTIDYIQDNHKANLDNVTIQEIYEDKENGYRKLCNNGYLPTTDVHGQKRPAIPISDMIDKLQTRLTAYEKMKDMLRNNSERIGGNTNDPSYKVVILEHFKKAIDDNNLEDYAVLEVYALYYCKSDCRACSQGHSANMVKFMPTQ